jgi:hypothetical protein
MEKQMTKKNTANSSENGRRDESKLDSRYGEIGISAVAAALRYASGCKTESAKTESAKTESAKTESAKTGADADAAVSPKIKWLAELAA